MTEPWVNILANVGWPTDVVVLDFETFFDAKYTLKKLSTVEYIMDPRFEALGLAYLRQRPAAPPAVSGWYTDIPQLLSWLQSQYGEDLAGCTLVMQNAQFDLSILAWKFGVCPLYVVDTLGLARHINPAQRNDLKHLAERYGLPAKGDTNEFSGMHRTDTLQAEALGAYATNDVNLEFRLFAMMLPELTRPAFELPLMMHTLRMYVYPCIEIDQEAGAKLVNAMKSCVDETVAAVSCTRAQISGNKSFISVLQEALGDEPVPMKAGKNGLIPEFAKDDAGLAYLKQHQSSRVRDLISARVAVKSWPLHIARVCRIMAQAQAAGGLIPVPLKYCGAHTGRWSGGEKINLQNLGARSPEPLINQVRSLLVAPDGSVLIVTDAAQIEARVDAWLAGQWDLVKAFAEGREIYCEFASEVVGRHIRKARKTDPGPVATYLKRFRQMGKVVVLGGGYGMGWKKLRVFASTAYQVDLDETTARRLIAHYRAKYTAIVKFWGDIEAAFKIVTRYPHEVRELPRGLKLWNRNDTVFVQLPSGRCLRYHKARVIPMQDDYGRVQDQIRWPDTNKPDTFVYAWGGLLTENIVQAISRDILAEAILVSEEQGQDIGLRIGHHVHDETIGVVRKEHGEIALAIQLAALRRRPTWAPECPLDAEGSIMERYGK